MPRLRHGGPRGASRGSVAFRAVCFLLAAVLAVAAVWLLVTGKTQKTAQIGALVGFWAVLMAAFPVFGTRHADGGSGGQLDVRRSTEVDRVADAAEQRVYELRLQEMLRREIAAALRPELTSLRSDIAALRSELVDKVGGQLRLEHIQTTRVIGSDIEALQHEVRQLKGREPGDFSGFPVGRAGTYVEATDEQIVSASRPSPPAPAPATPDAPTTVIDDLRIERLPVPEADPAVGAHVGAEPVEVSAEAPPKPVADYPHYPSVAQPATSPTPPPPTGVPAAAGTVPDPFASLPRIRPFTDIPVDPPESKPEPEYAGRRRYHDEAPAQSDETGDRSNAANGSSPESGSGGRRRREAAEDDDMLARILAREGIRR